MRQSSVPPRVTIGMPLYQAERYLDSAFRSLLGQDHPDFELVVCDNASTDRTWEICQRFAAADPRIRLYRNDSNLGAAANYNRVVALARGELFRWAAYDDWCAPSLVSSCVAALDRAGPGVVLAYPQTVLIDENDTVLGPYADRLDLPDRRAWRRVGDLMARFSLCNPVFGVIRTDVLRRTGLIRPYPSSDVTLLAELAARGRFHEVPEPLFHRRIHPGSSRQGRGPDRRGLPGVAAWFDPRGRGSVRAPRLRLTVRSVQALLGAGAGAGAGEDLGRGARLACAASFVTRYWLRRARIVAGRLRRTALGRPISSSLLVGTQKGAGDVRT
ncbi:MAG: glycosyltransferase [Micromonosporaceae bacterium]|nr:glycosyltransferase [Micromonosporaceae bacterium]